mmetsp:Transcript_12649/g.39976  ORF Transcript_12649/g.39976 Transcript_12649/m.39976 type:complete len:347 (-) Transcript_12649:981-2021(-)
MRSPPPPHLLFALSLLLSIFSGLLQIWDPSPTPPSLPLLEGDPSLSLALSTDPAWPNGRLILTVAILVLLSVLPSIGEAQAEKRHDYSPSFGNTDGEDEALSPRSEGSGRRRGARPLSSSVPPTLGHEDVEAGLVQTDRQTEQQTDRSADDDAATAFASYLTIPASLATTSRSLTAALLAVSAVVCVTFLGKRMLGEARPCFYSMVDYGAFRSNHTHYLSIVEPGRPLRAELILEPAALPEALASFPSGHASLSAAGALLIARRLGAFVAWRTPRVRRDLRILLLLLLHGAASWLPLYVGRTRVYEGWHRASDVGFGWLVGSFVTLATERFSFSGLQRRQAGPLPT